MQKNIRALIIDGYDKKSRTEFDTVGMTKACDLYKNMLLHERPEAKIDIFFPSDPDGALARQLSDYNTILWTGCNLTVYNTHEDRVRNQIEIAKSAYSLGIPSFGSCWGLQIAVFAAGGKVSAHPKGKEMGVARKISLTNLGSQHPMYTGKRATFDAFISHDDEVNELPQDSELLASNEYTKVQAAVVRHQKGEFWGVQYHPEYNLVEMARLIKARQEKLITQKFFSHEKDLITYTDSLEKIAKNPNLKDLSWQYAIDQDIIDKEYRTLEFKNFINYFY